MIATKHFAIFAIRNSRHPVEKYYSIFGINKSREFNFNLTNADRNGSVFRL